MYGGAAGLATAYNCNADYFFVVGGDGIITWRGFYDDAGIRGAIDQALAQLVSPATEIPFAGNRLLENYPNPFNPLTRIPFELAVGDGEAPVSLQILDLRGRVVSTLVDGRSYARGQRHEVTWDGTDNTGLRQPSGTYLARLRVDGTEQLRMLTLVK